MYILVTDLISCTRHGISNVSLGTILLNIDSVLWRGGLIVYFATTSDISFQFIF